MKQKKTTDNRNANIYNVMM